MAGDVRRPRLLFVYTRLVTLAGLGVAGVSLGRTLGDGLHATAATGLLFALTLLAGRWAVAFHGRRHISAANMFAFALALTGPVALGVAALQLGTALHRIRKKSPWQVIAFTVGQQGLCLLAARAIFSAMTGHSLLGVERLQGSDVLGVVVSAIGYLVATDAAVAIAQSLEDDLPIVPEIANRIVDGFRTWGLWLTVAPALVAAMQVSPLLLVPLMVPTLHIFAAFRRDEQRAEQALRDPLTGLPNRSLLHDRLSQLLADSGREMRGFALLVLDLDHFKEINDTLGFQVGDRLIQRVAERLAGAVRDADTVARLGGDEFAILASSIDTANGAIVVAERLQAALRSTITIDGVKLDVASSIGIAVSPMHGTEADVLLQRADVALYAAKEQRGCWEIYQPESDPHTVERLGMLGELRSGIETGQLVVHYQPKANAFSGQVIGVEALVRWMHPTRGLLSPDQFVPLAESTGLIGELTVVVLRQALAQVRTWMLAGTGWDVAVNLSARQLSDLALPRDVAALLSDFAVPAHKLTLEVTETTIMSDPTRTLTVLNALADLGVKLSIDDFGTGYSSLSHLKRLQAHELKIDRSFISGMSASSNDAVIVRSTIELGHNLGLSLVAEGVEDETTWQLLRDLGCDVIQGYHLSRPLPSDALSEWAACYQPNVKRLSASSS